jgi:hypothetical protein
MSDIDLAVVLPDNLDATHRVAWLKRLLDRKRTLEDDLGKLLRRPSRDTFVCSVIALTQRDIVSEIHKDGATSFFSTNRFLNLLTGSEMVGLPNAGANPVEDRLVGECIRFAQKKRNSYLAINALGSETLSPYDGPDVAPKDIMRHSAMVQFLKDDGDGDPGAEYDVELGLNLLTVLLHERRKGLPALNRKFSIRRGGRGSATPLSSEDQLLLSEIVLDACLDIARNRADVPAEPKKPSTNGQHSTVIFAHRFAATFPGVRSIEWFDEAALVKQRLDKLLEEPLEYADATPIWWSRGHSNLQITSFVDEGDRYVLNRDEMSIRRIAAVGSSSYKHQFVYVEVAALATTGLYSHTADRIAEVKAGTGNFKWYWEEFGIVDGKHLVTRSVYDDGSAVIDGHLQSIQGRVKGRSRHVTPYNFIIAAAGAPILSMDYDEKLEGHLDAMLKGEDRLSIIAQEVLRVPSGRW